MNIEINNRTKHKLDLKLVKQVVSTFARTYKIRKQEISIAFVGDSEIQKLNQAYRGLNQATDVLAFASLNSADGNLTGQAGEGDYFGEIIIDYNQIKRQADKFNHSSKEEMVFILVHGLLHLMGYDDETDKARQKMMALGEKFIKNLKL